MVLATDMKFLGKGTPAGQMFVENSHVKKSSFQPLEYSVFTRCTYFLFPNLKVVKGRIKNPSTHRVTYENSQVCVPLRWVCNKTTRKILWEHQPMPRPIAQRSIIFNSTTRTITLFRIHFIDKFPEVFHNGLKNVLKCSSWTITE